MADSFEELYGTADPEEPVKPAEGQQPAAPATAAAAPAGDGDDLFLQLYGEAALEQTGERGQPG